MCGLCKAACMATVAMFVVCNVAEMSDIRNTAVADEPVQAPLGEETAVPEALLRKAPEPFRKSYRYVNKAIRDQTNSGQPIDPLLFISRAELSLHVMDKRAALSDIRSALDAMEQVPTFERGAIQRRCIELTIQYHEVPDIEFAADASDASTAGDLALRRGKYPQASRLFEAAAKLDTKDYRSCYLAAVCFKELEKTELAKMWLTEAVVRESRKVRVYRRDVSALFLRRHHARDLELIQGRNRAWLESEALRLLVPELSKMSPVKEFIEPHDR